MNDMRMIRCLVVDDEPQILRVMRASLPARGYEVRTATNGQEALDEMHKEMPDLLILDLVMPEMSGKELVDHLKEQRADLKVLFMSGYTDEAIVHHGVLDSSVEFIQKPFTPASLIRRVRDVLDSNGTKTNGRRPGPETG